MKTYSAERRRVAELADRYFAEQCARLGPIGGAAAPSRKSASTRAISAKMNALVSSEVARGPAFTSQRFGVPSGAGAGSKKLDRFRL